MTTVMESQQASVPQLTLGWRLQMALGHGHVTVQEMADDLGMARSSLSRWLNDHGAPPRRIFILRWAVRTGVDAHWLEFGHTKNPRPDDPDGGCTQCQCAIRDSNPEPAGLGHLLVMPAAAAA